MHDHRIRASRFAIAILLLLTVVTLNAQDKGQPAATGTYRIAHVSTDQTYLDLGKLAGRSSQIRDSG